MAFRIFIIIFCLTAIVISVHNIIIESYKSDIFWKADKIFHYFDTYLLLLHNGNINKMYPGLVFSKILDNSESAELGYRLEFTYTCFIGEYKQLNGDKESLYLHRLFILPVSKYNEIIKTYGQDFSSFNLIDESCLHIKYNEYKNEIDVLAGESSINDYATYTVCKQIKNLMKRYYNIITMKRLFLGCMCVPPEILDIMMEFGNKKSSGENK